MKKILLALIAITMVTHADAKVNIGKGVAATVLGTLTFPSIVAAEFYAFGLQKVGKCDNNHNVIIYIPLPKKDEFNFVYTCEEWVK